MFRALLTTSFVLVSTCYVWSQSALDKLVELKSTTQTIEQHFKDVQEKGSITLTFSPSHYNIAESVSLNRSKQSIREHLNDILVNYPSTFTISESNPNRIILKPDLDAPAEFLVKGVVTDKMTGDPVIGVNISIDENQLIGFSDEDGFFQVSVRSDQFLRFDLIGYTFKDVVFDKTQRSSLIMDIEMDADNLIPEVLITGQEINSYIGDPGTRIPARNISSYTNFLGDNNILEEIKTLPAVQSGNEGQTGLIVRGGGTEQNLIRFDGVPLYEMSHLAGLSSILFSGAVNDVIFYNEGFPARYGGRLSSVMDVNLKSGKSKKRMGSISGAITGSNIYSSGPITDRLSYNAYAKISWINLYLDPLLRETYNYTKTDLGFYDLTGKLSYQLSKNSSISLTSYRGEDRIDLNRQTNRVTDASIIDIGELNKVDWQNRLSALNYKNIIRDNWILKAHLSNYRYRQSSRGNLEFEERNFQDSILSNSALDVLTYSTIEDINAYVDLSYHPNDQISIKAGVGSMRHKFTPTVRQSTFSIFDNPTDYVDGDSSIVANDNYAYVELMLKAFQNFDINMGVRRSSYEAREKQYSFTEPRLSLIYRPHNRHFISLNYSTMVQYVHLLVNPSVGLPSDLWVPSTNHIEPEFAQHYSIGYRYRNENFEASVSGYYKEFENLLEYSNSFDLFYSILNQGEFVPVFNSSNEWERRVSSGNGTARGVELSMTKAFKKAKFNLSYAYAKSSRTFNAIDNGETFPHKFDRRHDINVSGNYKINDSWDVAAKWIYATGNTFTLALEEFITPDQVKVLRASGRNNFRHLPFHHLDLHVNRIFKYDRFSSRLSLGVYNVYNRLNPFYVFLYRSQETDLLSLRQVSLYPIIPHVSYTISW